jgi:hypothetical protein
MGRYVSNAAGRNKGGAPIEIDELIGEWRRPAAFAGNDGEAGSLRAVHRTPSVALNPPGALFGSVPCGLVGYDSHLSIDYMDSHPRS